MGLSSSQARLLTLTGRMHDIEYKAQKLEAQKLQMANESRRVYEDYLIALDSAKLQIKTLSTDGSVQYIDATYNNLIDNGYILKLDDKLDINKISGGKYIINQDDINLFNQVTSNGINISDGNRDFFAAVKTGRVDTSGVNKEDGTREIYTAEQFVESLNNNNSNYRLMYDLDFTNVSKQTSTGYIANFSSYLDGNGHTISNLSSALFDNVTGGTIQNLEILNSNITSTNSTGVLTNNATNITVDNVLIKNTTINVSTNSTSPYQVGFGGLIGTISGSPRSCISNSTIDGINITGDFNNTDNDSYQYNVGGLIGNTFFTDVTISNSQVRGANISIDNQSFGNSTYIGGFVGHIEMGDPIIENCFSESYIETTKAGGFLGGFYGETNAQLKIGDCISSSIMTSAQFDDFLGTNALGIDSDNNAIYTSECCAIATIFGENSTFGNPSNYHEPESSTTLNNSYILTGSEVNKAREIFNAIASEDYVKEGTFIDPIKVHGNDPAWLLEMINQGYIRICVENKDGKISQVSIATDTGLQEVADETALKKAEAKYEADMKKIDLKDRKYDIDLAALDAERKAIKQEMETLKTVAKDNVDRTFKLF